jgi:hypothetical protein
MKRTWRYRYGSWLPPWWAYLIPQIGSTDEYGRKTAVIHIPFWGFLVWAYKTCHCEDCVESREQGWDKEWTDAVT